MPRSVENKLISESYIKPFHVLFEQVLAMIQGGRQGLPIRQNEPNESKALGEGNMLDSDTEES